MDKRAVLSRGDNVNLEIGQEVEIEGEKYKIYRIDKDGKRATLLKPHVGFYRIDVLELKKLIK